MAFSPFQDRETKEALDRLRPKFNEVIESLKRMCDEKCNSETQAASSEKVIKCMDTCVKVEYASDNTKEKIFFDKKLALLSKNNATTIIASMEDESCNFA
ncbi:hypothetical protein D918_04543 [Trichuris suis]|nr:hypothetical protein D918_04543 [Trichuris suis]